jgi:predicted dehydrogenase
MSISVGLVGTGYWARTVHATSLARHSETVFRGVWGRNRAHRESLAREHGVTSFASFDALLREVDVVDFAIPPEAQLPLAIVAARAGKDLLLEKPIALTVAEALELNLVVQTAGVAAVVFMTRLFDPVRRGWLDDQVGRGWERARTINISSALTAGPYANSAWRQRNNGVLWDIGPHVLSQLEYVLGPVHEASLLSHDPLGATRLSFVHASGAQSTALMTLRAQPEEKMELVEFTGSSGGSRSPSAPLDFVLSHSHAMTALTAAKSRVPHTAEQEGFTVAAGVRHTSTLAAVDHVLRKAVGPDPMAR